MTIEATDQNSKANIDNWTALIDQLGPKFAERTSVHDADDSFVADNYEELKSHKFFSAQVPSELGGGGLSHSQMCELIRRLATYCSSTGLATSMHQHLVAAAIYNYRHGKPGQALLEKVAGNELVLVSTGANDWLESSGSIERVDGGYKVTAFKPFASGSPAGDLAITSAPYEDPDEGWQVLHFPVPLSAEGASLVMNWKAHGMRGTGSNTIKLDEVFIPEESVALKRPQGEFHPAWNVILTVALPLIASAYLGVAQSAARIAREKNATREDAVTQMLMGEMENQLVVAELAVESMIANAANGEFEPVLERGNASLVRKTLAVRAAANVVERAIEATGGAGYFRSGTLERLRRDVAAGNFHPLPEKRQQLFTGRLAMELDPISGRPQDD
jgi:alkylation response protein AidB-like acyl-CoA dehydrogenase